jgi:hypothetical protein
METPELTPDVYDPTTDPRHQPSTAAPGPNPTVPRPRDPDPNAVPPPDEPVITPAGAGSKPAPVRQ